MRCEQCNYTLWNLKTRECPECGRAFRPSQHEFVANSVRFCCLECDQPYYGTGPRGHLSPPSFECVKCGAPQTMDEMVLRPTAGVDEAETRVETMPWLERARMGRLAAWFRTIGRSMVMPAALIRSAPPERGHGQAWWYAILTLAIFMAVGVGAPFYVGALVSLFASSKDALGLFAVGSSFAVGGLIMLLLATVLWGLVTHAALRLTGGTSYGLGRTYQTFCYSAGATVTMAVPCIGIYPFAFIGLGWWLVSAIMMLTVGQRVHPGRAVFAAMVFPVLGGAAIAAGGAGLTMYGLAQVQTMVAQASEQSKEVECTIMLDALLAHADQEGAWPAHAFAMVPGEMVTALDFVAGDTATFEQSVPLADTTLDIAAGMTPGARRAVIDAVIAGQPVDLVAHRVGDFVFTYHGVLVDAPDEALWLVVMSPDPSSNVDASINGVILVGFADSSVESIDEADFAERLDQQNVLRAENGLPPLPDPATVVHLGS